jgi:uncharacterized protein (DUF2141 family)
MTRGRYPFIVAVLFSVIMGCAKISSPSGGPKDITPPVVVKSLPANGEKNFRGNKIIITFDEYVVLDKINEKFMVSPPLKEKPVITMKGKNVIVSYDEKLQDSTTYTFNFQDAIRDLNENNVLENYQFVFSTGPVIDSLSVTGNVYRADNLEPPENTIILLYENLADSAVRKQLPSYISQADKNGYFRINNLRSGTYRLYALKDVDNSKNYNLPDEEFAFMSNAINVTAADNYIPFVKDTVLAKPKSAKADTIVLSGEHKLYMFKAEKKSHYLTSSSRNTQYKLTYTLSLPPDSLAFDFSIPGKDRRSFFTERNAENDTLVVWLTDSTLYSQPQVNTLITYPYTDTTGNVVLRQDTILLRFLIPRTTRLKPKPVPFKILSNISRGSIKPDQQIVMNSVTPFIFPDTSRIRIYELSGEDMIKIPYSFVRDTSNSCRLIMKTNLAQGKTYLYVADSASYGDIYGEISDSTGVKFIVKSEKNLGSLSLKIQNYDGPRIIQLLTNTEKMVMERKMDSDGGLEFKYLDPGKYRIKAIYDLNNDGKWTTGDFDREKQPEPVSYYWQEVDVKEGWKMDQDWDLSQKNFKKFKKLEAKSPGR